MVAQNVSLPMPWDRQPKETTKAFRAFRLYLQGGMECSYREVAATLKVNIQQMKDWGTKYGWVGRAALYDSYIQGQMLEQLDAAVVAFQANVVQDEVHDYNSMRVLWLQMLERLATATKNSEAAVDDLTNGMRRLVAARDTMDKLARRAARMASTYTEDDEDMSREASYMLDFNSGPKRIDDGD